MVRVFALFACVIACAASSAPNVMFILADDLGYNELNFMNNTRGILTPNLDKLANSGVVMKNYYVQPICSPTRSALMTGRYTTRLGTHGNVIYWDTPWGIPINETFVPENMKDAGYSTAMFGKWHLGMHKQEYTPMGRGFDQHMGYYQGCGSAWTHEASCCTAGSNYSDQDFVCPAKGEWKGSKDFRGYDWFKTDKAGSGVSIPDKSANHTNSATLIRDAAIEYVHAHAGEDAAPWFMYLPFQNIHSPYTTDKKFYDMYANNTHGLSEGEMTMFGYLTEMDDAVGLIVQALHDASSFANTVFIFSSDNGAPPTGNMGVDHKDGDHPYIARNHPYRGWKTQIWEGGSRVAGFVSTPRADLLPPSARGTESHGLFHVTDWLPTIVGLGRGNTSRNMKLDGFDIWPALTMGGVSPRKELLYNINPLCSGGQAGPPKAGLRIGDYKLMSWCYEVAGIAGGNRTGPVNLPQNSKKGDPEFKKGPVLYNLAKDPSETTNIADSEPAVMSSMLARLQELAEEMVEPMQWTPPFQGPDYVCADCPLHPNGTGVDEAWGPWL